MRYQLKLDVMNNKLFHRCFLALAAVFAFNSFCLAQTEMEAEPDTTGIPFVAYWEKGDSYDFLVTKIKKQWKEGALTKNDSVSYRANFLVLDSTETNYKIKWTYETNFSDLSIPSQLIPNLEKYKTTEVIYWTDELGAFEEIENWRDISRQMNSMLDEIIPHIAAADFQDESAAEAFKQMTATLKSIYNSEEAVERLVLKELQAFHFPMGVEFSVTEPIVYEDELPNMLGGEPIKADGKIWVESVDEEEGFCILAQQLKVNEADAKNMLMELFNQIGIEKSEVGKAFTTSAFDITDNNRYEYFYYPCVPYKIETRRNVIMNINNEDGLREDILRIELLLE